jgi:hypothetical protein
MCRLPDRHINVNGTVQVEWKRCVTHPSTSFPLAICAFNEPLQGARHVTTIKGSFNEPLNFLVGGMPTDEILKESGDDRKQALATIGSGLGALCM